MRLDGSCHCKRVRCAIETDLYTPFLWCHCAICRKTAGSAFGCNIKGRRADLEVLGAEHIRVYTAEHCQRHFCESCGSPLYILDDRWPEGCWPSASAIDTPLPVPPRVVHMFTKSKASWFEIPPDAEQHAGYPALSIDEYHVKFGWPPRKA